MFVPRCIYPLSTSSNGFSKSNIEINFISVTTHKLVRPAHHWHANFVLSCYFKDISPSRPFSYLNQFSSLAHVHSVYGLLHNILTMSCTSSSCNNYIQVTSSQHTKDPRICFLLTDSIIFNENLDKIMPFP